MNHPESSSGGVPLRAVNESNPSIGHMEEVDQFAPSELDAKKIIYAGMGNTQVLNIYRELRTQLLQLQKKKNFVCMVSSISHQGGASHVAHN